MPLELGKPQPYPIPGEFPDVEHVLVDLLTPLLYTCTTLPEIDPEDPMSWEDALPLIWARRTGGGVDKNDVTDRAIVQVTCLARTRADSTEVARHVRNALRDCPGTKVNGVLVDSSHEVSGLLEIPDLDPLNRQVEIGYALDFRRVR